MENIRVLKLSYLDVFFNVQNMEIITNLSELTNKPHTTPQHMSQLIWEMAKQTGKSTTNRISFNVDLVSLDCIAGSAMVIPYFTFHEKVKNK